MTRPDLMAAADRLWDAARALDDLRGDAAATEWTARKVRALLRLGRADDVPAVLRIAQALEDRLAREREPARRRGDA